jgi:phosphotriesterase-related protein
VVGPDGLAGKVVTVLGPVEPERLGRTLVHEHLFIDLRRCSYVPPPPELAPIAESLVAGLDRAVLAEHSCAVLDNLVLDDADLAAAELSRFAEAGGHAIVDVTPADIGRAPERLRALASASGVAMVMGCGHYCEIAHGEEVAGRSEDELLASLMAELEHGAGSSGVRPGIIGEIGVNGEERGSRRLVGEMTPTERRVLRAAAKAARATGAPMTIHLPSRASAVTATIAELEAVGAPMEQISLSHMDTIGDFRLHEEALEHGLWIQYDCFGMALVNDWYRDAGDAARIDWLARHRDAGRLGRVLVSHDVWCKAQLAAHGGGGYAHLLTAVVPRLAQRGFGEEDLDLLLVRNPAEFLAWREPSG